MSTTTTTPPTTATPPEGWRLAPPGRSTGPLGSLVAVARLTDQLQQLNVTLPVEIARLSATWATLSGLHQPKPEPAAGLLADADQIVGMATAAAQQRAVQAQVAGVVDRVERELLSDATSWYQHNADAVLDQMRPSFDKAAAAVTAAVAAGVHSSTSRLGDLPDDAVKLWRAAYGNGAATSQLNAMAAARHALSESCWVTPMEVGWNQPSDMSPAFNAPAGWWNRIGRSWEQVPDPRLLPTADSLALRWERRPSVYADERAEAHHRQQGGALNVARQPGLNDLSLADVVGKI